MWRTNLVNNKIQQTQINITKSIKTSQYVRVLEALLTRLDYLLSIKTLSRCLRAPTRTLWEAPTGVVYASTVRRSQLTCNKTKNIIINSTIQIAIIATMASLALGHWKVTMDCVHNERLVLFAAQVTTNVQVGAKKILTQIKFMTFDTSGCGVALWRWQRGGARTMVQNCASFRVAKKRRSPRTSSALECSYVMDLRRKQKYTKECLSGKIYV